MGPGGANALPGLFSWWLVVSGWWLVVGGGHAPGVARQVQADRTVIDLRWSNDAAPADDLPSFTAIQEQLGLKLEGRRVNADVFVVDRFERPIPV